ncbi:MAG: DNA methyltransferase [Ornithinimicrobium sp.]
MADPDLSSRLRQFVQWRRDFLRGDEKGEAQIFLERLFQAFGHGGVREAGAILEDRIHRLDLGGVAFADLMWKPRCLVEMKKAGTDLSRHYNQAFRYWVDAVPDRPRYVVLCNFDELWVYDFDKQLDAPMDRITLDSLPVRHDALAFMHPRDEQPIFGNDLVAVTRDVAAKVSRVFRSIEKRGVERAVAQRFVLQSVVAMFAEDIGLLPGHFFTRAVEEARDGTEAYDLLEGLFRAMNTPGSTPGGRYEGTAYFNGGLFKAVEPVVLTDDELVALREATAADWSAVQPEVFGTLFEQSMEVGERHAYGAHFTSQADIARIVQPTIVAPWTERIDAAKTIGQLEQLLFDMAAFRVLDPSCGSGNFLYVAYREMRRLEAEVKTRIDERRRSRELASQTALSYVTPDNFFGLDIKPVAVEVAKVTMMLGKKLAADELGDEQSVLPLDNLETVIRASDALLDPWPKADVVIGNPPYLGRRKMIEELGAGYVDALRQRHPHVGGVSDYVCHWFPLAHDHLQPGGRAGFVATQAIRDASSRAASLDYVVAHDGVIFDAVSSQPWSGDAAVHVSIVNWIKGASHAPAQRKLYLDHGDLVLNLDHIPASLSQAVDVAAAQPLAVNKKPKVTFQGQTTGNVAGFRLTLDQAREIVRRSPAEAAYIHPLTSGDPLISTLSPTVWVIDLPFRDRIEADQHAPELMKHLRRAVLPGREVAADKEAARNAETMATRPGAKPNNHHAKFLSLWWRHGYRRDDLIDAISRRDRYIALTIVAAEQRRSIYVFVDPQVRPDASLQAFALDDDYSFGILSSELHRTWFDERCSRLEARPRYTPTTVFDSFPWPSNPTDATVARVAEASAAIQDARAGYLERGITLVQMYDALREPGQSRFRDLHHELDDAVLAAYGFSPDDDVLAQLLALNLSAAGDPAVARYPGGRGMAAAYRSTYRLSPTDSILLEQ